jgi:hypothetical protein
MHKVHEKFLFERNKFSSKQEEGKLRDHGCNMEVRYETDCFVTRMKKS